MYIASSLASFKLHCARKRDEKYFLHNFNEFEGIAITFGKEYRNCIRKLLVEQMSTSPNQ